MSQNNPFIKILIKALAVLALGITLIPSILHFTANISSDQVNLWMAIGMLLWFVTGGLWLGKKPKSGMAAGEVPKIHE